MVPLWLNVLAWLWIAICCTSSLFVLVQTIRYSQTMWIMNVVWPVTALYLGPVAVYLYQKSLPVSLKQPASADMKTKIAEHKGDPPTLTQLSLAAFHCGAGCSIGDVIAELMVPSLAISFAGEFGTKLIFDFVFAYILGIAFQYFTIVPMRGLGFKEGLVVAARVDTISIALFEVGMFAWMAISFYWLFPSPHLKPDSAAFWFMMQIAMILGVLTSLPANAWLIRKGWKEKMPQLAPEQLTCGVTGKGSDQLNKTQRY